VCREGRALCGHQRVVFLHPDAGVWHPCWVMLCAVRVGVLPEGSTWAMMPMPPTWLGPRCLPGPNDTSSTPNGCQPWEHTLGDSPCVPCPGTPGSDCSRCDNNVGKRGMPSVGKGDG
jgi:hypothetical protein